MAIDQINDTTYEVTLSGGDKVEIGDREAIDFKPHLKLNRWDGECSISIYPSGLTEEEVEYEVEGDKIKCKYKVKYEDDTEDEFETEFYPLQPRTVIAKDKDGNDVEFGQCELGGFEFETFLPKKPKTNTIVLNIETQGLKFGYQPELTQQEIDDGAIHPDNIVSSYAVYHATKANHVVGQTNYMAGKAFHIYRPKITDAEGNWVWGDLLLDEQAGTLTTTIPQEFLDSAIYPVSTGTTNFGLESRGGTKVEDRDRLVGTAFNIPEDGTALKITGWVYTYYTTTKWRGVIYQGTTLIDTTPATNCGNLSGSTNWGDKLGEGNLSSSESLTSGVAYTLSLWISDPGHTHQVYYDALGSTGNRATQIYHATNDPANPITWDITEDGNIRYSIYCTYEAGVPGEQELTASPVAVSSSVVTSVVSGDGDAPLTQAVVAVSSSVQNVALAGTGIAPLTQAIIAVSTSVITAAITHTTLNAAQSPISVSSSVVNSALAPSGAAPLTQSPVAVSSSVQNSAIVGIGDAPLTAAVVSVSSSVVASSVSTGVQVLTAAVVSVSSSVQNSALAGTGIAPLTGAVVSVSSSVVASKVATTQILTAAVVSVTSSVQAATIAGIGTAPLTGTVVAVTSSVSTASIVGSGVAGLTGAVVAVTASVQNAVISGSGIAPLTGAVVAVTSSVVQATLSGSGTVSLTSSPIAVTSSVVNSSVANVSAVQELFASPIAVAASVQTATLTAVGAVTLLAASIAIASSVVVSSIQTRCYYTYILVRMEPSRLGIQRMPVSRMPYRELTRVCRW